MGGIFVVDSPAGHGTALTILLLGSAAARGMRPIPARDPVVANGSEQAPEKADA